MLFGVADVVVEVTRVSLDVGCYGNFYVMFRFVCSIRNINRVSIIAGAWLCRIIGWNGSARCVSALLSYIRLLQFETGKRVHIFQGDKALLLFVDWLSHGTALNVTGSDVLEGPCRLCDVSAYWTLLCQLTVRYLCVSCSRKFGCYCSLLSTGHLR